MPDIESDFVHLARFAVEGSLPELSAILRRSLPSLAKRRPDLSQQVKNVLARLQRGPTRTMDAMEAIPVDPDSRLELLRSDFTPVLGTEPVWPAKVEEQLSAVLEERRRETELID